MNDETILVKADLHLISLTPFPLHCIAWQCWHSRYIAAILHLINQPYLPSGLGLIRSLPMPAFDDTGWYWVDGPDLGSGIAARMIQGPLNVLSPVLVTLLSNLDLLIILVWFTEMKPNLKKWGQFSTLCLWLISSKAHNEGLNDWELGLGEERERERLCTIM